MMPIITASTKRFIAAMSKQPVITYSVFDMSVLQRLEEQTMGEHLRGVKNWWIFSGI
jgi:hypothetical protein